MTDVAPASTHASTTAASWSSLSERPGSTGATSTPHGMPASFSRATASTRGAGMGRARLGEAPDLLVERADRQAGVHASCAPAAATSRSRSRRMRRGLGEDGERVGGLGQHADDALREVVLALGPLVRVGVGAHGDGVARPPRRRQLGPQALDGVDLHHDLALEVARRCRSRGSRGWAGRSSRCRRGCSPGRR